jgi:hypothetical protein
MLEQTGTRADPNVREELSETPKAADAEDEKKQGLFKRWFGKKNEDE